MGEIVVEVRVKNGKLEQTPLSPDARKQIGAVRSSIMRDGTPTLKAHLQDTLGRAGQRPGADPVEPLLVLKSPDDTLKFQVIDEREARVTDFSVEVIPFPGDAVHRGGAPPGTPDAFAGFREGTRVPSSNGVVVTGPPTQAAAQFVFNDRDGNRREWRWHKFILRVPRLNLELDPCIFVRD